MTLKTGDRVFVCDHPGKIVKGTMPEKVEQGMAYLCPACMSKKDTLLLHIQATYVQDTTPDDCVWQINEWIQKLIVANWTHDNVDFSFTIEGMRCDYLIHGNARYLGCQAVAKDGETCSDESDGPFGIETWMNILTDIVAIETGAD